MKLDRRNRGRGGGRDTAGDGAGSISATLYSVCFVWKRGPRVLLVGMVAISFLWMIKHQQKDGSSSSISRTTTTTLDEVVTATARTATAYDPHRLCAQNPYGPSLAVSLATHADEMDTWLEKKVQIERDLNHDPASRQHNHKRFDAFAVMGQGCDQQCIGGACRQDTSKITCGVTHDNMVAPCVVYSIGGNNQWQFEQGILDHTPCDVHTFDCTGPITRFDKKPNTPRSHFHHICLGTKDVPAVADPSSLGTMTPQGEFQTLQHIQHALNHTQIDVLKMDIEGYEWPILLDAWPTLTERSAPTTILPMQILLEVHYRGYVGDLALSTREDIKHANDMIQLQTHLLRMGYATIIRDNNGRCAHCTELTLIRIKCPAPAAAATAAATVTTLP